MRAPFCYYGGKMGMGTKIARLFTEHKTYIEPFFGSGAVFFAKRPARHEIVNDVDGAVVAFFRCLRDRREELEEACALSPVAREEYEGSDPRAEGLDELEAARRFWVRVNQGFAKTAGPWTGWSVTTARTQSVAASIYSRLGRFAACAERLSQASIECCDAVGLIERLATEDTVVYADPPYVAASRIHRAARATVKDYAFDMAQAPEHERLLKALRATPATVFLSGYGTDLYAEKIGDWPRIDFAVTAHSSNAATSSRSRRVECLWSNRPFREEGLFSAERMIARAGQ